MSARGRSWRRFTERQSSIGKVYLVGAGPGDPELITWKGRKALESAGAVLYDNLACPSLLDLAPREAERLYVGKKQSMHAFTQEEIGRMMIDRARRGLTVVRLKGGDPFIFGRGGEEAEDLAEAGIPFEVVPGVTTALGVAAYSGVPLTHRKHSRMVSIVTGHDAESVDWRKACEADTLVLYMGLTHFAEIAASLIACGRSPDTPALAVRWATKPKQRCLEGTLATLPALLEEKDLRPPVTIVVGDVVRLHRKLNWFEKLPLFGQRIAVTRAHGQAGSFGAKLRALGAEPIDVPTIEIQAPEDSAPLDEAVARLDSYDWLIFTSANGVRTFVERLDASKSDLRAVRGKICAIGPATRDALQSLHLKVDMMPAEYVAESLVQAFASVDLAGRRILLPRAAVARDVVPAELSRRGAQVDVVEAYRTVIPRGAAMRVKKAFNGTDRPDWITFTSSSTVKNFLEVAGKEMLDGVRVASIGPVTSETARKHGLEVAVEASPYTMDGLLQALIEYHRSAGM